MAGPHGARESDRIVLRRSHRMIPALTFVAALALMLNQSRLPIAKSEVSGWVLEYGRWIPLGLLVLVVGIRVVLARRLPRRIEWFDLCAVCFLAVAVASNSYSIEPRLTLPRSLTLVLAYVAVFWGIWPDGSDITPDHVARALVSAVAAVLVVNLVAGPFLQPFDMAWRLQGAMARPNTLGILLALALPLALWWADTHPGRVAAAQVGTMLLMLLASQSRTGVFGAIAGAGYYAFHRFAAHRRLLVTVASVALVMTVLVPQAIWVVSEISGRRDYLQAKEAQVRLSEVRLRAAEQEVNRRQGQEAAEVSRSRRQLERAREAHESAKAQLAAAEPQVTLREALDLTANPRSLEFNTASGRTVVWKLGLDYLKQRPWLGFGFGTEELVLNEQGFDATYSAFFGSYFHNSYLGLALQVGLIGSVLFFFPLAALTWSEWRSREVFSHARLRFALRATLLTGLVVSCLESWVYSMGNAFAFFYWTSIMLLAWTNRAGRCGFARASEATTRPAHVANSA